VRDITEDETFTITEGPITASGTNPPIAVTQCVPQTEVLLITTIQITCSHRWSYAQGLSPFGARMNLRPNRRLQPTASLLAGYILSSQKTPIDAAGSFNFSFEIGAGLEYFLSPKHSMRFEYQLQHFSNAYTALQNPGVDSGLFKLSYTFGR
jgi:opacity protein-like surface antigen